MGPLFPWHLYRVLDARSKAVSIDVPMIGFEEQPSLSFSVYITQDGSPTLQWPTQPGRQEKMHSQQGALSESLYIYGEGLKHSIQQLKPENQNVLSIGTGLGYNEMIAAALFSKNLLSNSRLDSFEIDPFLRESFRDWILCKKRKENLLWQLYDKISLMLEKELNVKNLHQLLNDLYKENRLTLNSEFTLTQEPLRRYSTIFFDPFCSLSSPEFWKQENLQVFLKSHCAEKCVLTTYAATGELKRSLIQQGFKLHKRKGFALKRESIFATRGNSDKRINNSTEALAQKKLEGWPTPN